MVTSLYILILLQISLQVTHGHLTAHLDPVTNQSPSVLTTNRRQALHDQVPARLHPVTNKSPSLRDIPWSTVARYSMIMPSSGQREQEQQQI